MKDWLIPTFGPRQKRSLGNKRAFFQDVFPQYNIKEHPEYVDEMLCYDRVFMEIGFGGGEHLVGMAEQYSDVGFIGCEPFINGVVKCVTQIHEKELSNVKLWSDDARLLLQELPDQCLDRLDILFPDPWPKKKQFKRRLIQQDHLDQFHRVLKDGATLQLATDHVDYGRWMLHHMQRREDYQWLATSPRDWVESPKDWVRTRYQEKAALEGREPLFLTYRVCHP